MLEDFCWIYIWLLLGLMANKEEKEAEKRVCLPFVSLCVSWSVDKTSLRPISLL